MSWASLEAFTSSLTAYCSVGEGKAFKTELGVRKHFGTALETVREVTKLNQETDYFC